MKDIEQAISGNLAKMKELLNKKAQNDAYLKGITEDSRQAERNILKITQLADKFKEYV